MAGAGGQTTDRLRAVAPEAAGTSSGTPERVAALARLGANPHRFTLFAALRLLEQCFPDHPRLGESRKAADDPVRLGQAPSLSFAPSDVTGFHESPSDGPARLEQYSFGIFGPNGSLPLHLTEYAYERGRQREDATFTDFVNLFQHRLTSLFYRAWADAEPAASCDRPESDRFRQYVGALLGLGTASARSRDAAPDRAKLSRVAHFAPQPRSADGLESILTDYFGLTVQVRQFVGEWMDVPRELFCRIGRDPGSASLGLTAALGALSWQCQHKFEIVIGPLALGSFADLLPGSRGLAELAALVRLYTNDEWSWQLRLLLRDVEVPGVRLGAAGRLGWTTWLGGRGQMADDVVIQEPASDSLRWKNMT
ncbi:MAG TPA: type VI secretion system baseplate subunit TssG [Steroidobacteraceae bacterium]|jgi:type VI secretion system protein ImpH|nr:type VI secretion system baseplate subunit TssG [Steroidobacteraceae bacterium]